jgi:hypothetical protein
MAVQQGGKPRLAVTHYRQQIGHGFSVVVSHYRHIRLMAWGTQTEFHQLTAVKEAAVG